MKWKDLSLKERKQIYDSVRANNPDATYFDIKEQLKEQIHILQSPMLSLLLLQSLKRRRVKRLKLKLIMTKSLPK